MDGGGGMLEFFITYIVLCIFLVVQYSDKDNVFTLKQYINFKKNVAMIIATEVLLLLFLYSDFSI